MRKAGFIFFYIVVSLVAKTQVVFKTFVTQQPVIAGESFQVEYVLEDFDKSSEFAPPEFKNFRLVSGPFVYEKTAFGTDEVKRLKNTVYTLEALKPGRYVIQGATAIVNDRLIKSDNAVVEVISRAEAFKKGLLYERERPQNNDESFLKPGEDPHKKMAANLYMKVMVDKKSCFVGEPVTATFKLYSRLRSKSDIVKNPGFYGFTVQDIVGLNDNLMTSETINGKMFDVHTIRKVQLYPLQAGLFTIDAMEVENQVEFSKKAVSDKAEHEIVEGVFADGLRRSNIELYENSMHTEPVSITVKPVPPKNKPADFNGATGKFTITAIVNKTSFHVNEEAELSVIISGKGNFTQLTAPVVKWPGGIEGFEAKSTDSLDHQFSPLKGNRSFRFSFVPAKTGDFVLPAISFSFFDPDSNHYKTVSTKSLNITVSDAKGSLVKEGATKPDSNHRSYEVLIFAGILAVLASAGGWLLWNRRKNKLVPEKFPVKEEPLLPVTAFMQPVSFFIEADDKLFYTKLREGMCNFFADRWGLSGSKMNNSYLESILRERNADPQIRETIIGILQQCETGIYTDAVHEVNKKELLKKTITVLEKVDQGTGR